VCSCFVFYLSFISGHLQKACQGSLIKQGVSLIMLKNIAWKLCILLNWDMYASQGGKITNQNFFIFFPNYLSFQDFHASLFCIMSLIVSSQFTIERDISVSAWCVLFPVKNISCNMPLLPSKMNIYFPAAEPGLEISHFAMRTKWLIFHKPGSFLLWHEI